MLIQQETWITPLDEARTIHLYIPDGLMPGQKVPVLYMFDGHNLFVDEEATYGKSWGLKDYLEQTRLPLVVVGLECTMKATAGCGSFHLTISPILSGAGCRGRASCC